MVMVNLSSEYSGSRSIRDFMYGVYGLMSFALGISAITAYLINHFYLLKAPAIQDTIFANPFIMIGLLLIQLGLVFGITFFINRLSFPTALAMFIIYSIFVGITLSTLFLVWATTSIVKTFVVTAGMFGITALYGYITKTDLTTIGNIALMAMFGLLLGLLVNMFTKSPQFDLILSAAGVIIFTILTAADVQKIKLLGQGLLTTRSDDEVLHKVYVIGALTLYLDFLNLFLFMLRFMGSRRQD